MASMDIPDSLKREWETFVSSSNYTDIFQLARRLGQVKVDINNQLIINSKFVAVIAFAAFCQGWYSYEITVGGS